MAQLLLLLQLLVALLLLLPPLLLLLPRFIFKQISVLRIKTAIMLNILFPRRRARRKMMTWASDSSTKLGALLRSQLDKLCHPQIVPCCLK